MLGDTVGFLLGLSLPCFGYTLVESPEGWPRLAATVAPCRARRSPWEPRFDARQQRGFVWRSSTCARRPGMTWVIPFFWVSNYYTTFLINGLYHVYIGLDEINEVCAVSLSWLISASVTLDFYPQKGDVCAWSHEADNLCTRRGPPVISWLKVDIEPMKYHEIPSCPAETHWT